jgi:hypothetical protein
MVHGPTTANTGGRLTLMEIPDLISIIVVLQTLLILWLTGKVSKLERDTDLSMKVPMYALFQHINNDHPELCGKE